VDVAVMNIGEMRVCMGNRRVSVEIEEPGNVSLTDSASRHRPFRLNDGVL
jgi:hypothetical protein